MKNENIEFITTIISETADKIIEDMHEGERITFSEIISRISIDTSIPKSTVSGVIRLYAHNNNKIEVSAGRDGGLFKGSKPKKVIEDKPRCPTCQQTLKQDLPVVLK